MTRSAYKHWPDGSQMTRKTIPGPFKNGPVRQLSDDVTTYRYRPTYLDPLESVPDDEGERLWNRPGGREVARLIDLPRD